MTANEAVVERNTCLKLKAKYSGISHEKLAISLGLVYTEDKFNGKSCSYTVWCFTPKYIKARGEEMTLRIHEEVRIEHWVADGLENDFRDWNHHHAVLISAQTGRGKNHFIMDKLIPYALETKQEVFVFSNRVALSTQQKKILLKKLSIPLIVTDDKLREQINFGPITVLNYQSALNFLALHSKGIPLGGAPMAGRPGKGYAIFDEAHFFLSDAIFNSDTQRIFAELVKAFSYYTRIYMTATPENIVPFIYQYEQANEYRKYITGQDLIDNRHIERQTNKTKSQYRSLPKEIPLAVYKFAYDYSPYEITFFTNFDFLLEKIRKASTNDKWLLFINSRARQKEIAAMLQGGDSAKKKQEVTCFDSTKKRDEKIWSSLMNGNIPGNVLLTTSALDNGVNLTDPGLKNIVIEFEDKISFLQMLGRKRLSEGETVKVYVRSPSPAYVRQRLDSMCNLSSFIQEYKQNNPSFLQRKWKDFHQKYRNLFWVDNDQRLICNEFADSELNFLGQFYTQVLFQMQQTDNVFECDDIYPKLVLAWLKQSGEVQWVDEDNVHRASIALENLLEQHLESGISEVERDTFFQEFRRLGNIMYNGRKTIENDPRSARAIMSRCLGDFQELLEATYEVTGRGKNGWTIIKK